MKAFINFIVLDVFGRVNWTGWKYFFTSQEYNLTDEDIDSAVKLMSEGRYVCLSRRNTHLSTLGISLLNYLMLLFKGRGKYKARLGHWSHCFLHIESGENLDVVEAVGRGVVKGSYRRALNVDSLVLLKPKYLNPEEMEEVNELAVKYIGRLYDADFNLNDDSRLSCVELAFRSIMRVNAGSLPGLNAMIRDLGNLTPQMFYDCGDFEVIFEARR